jgi:hypothetical protein
VAKTRSGTHVLVLGVLLLLPGGCRQPHQGWEPPLEETTTRFLQTEVGEAIKIVRDAQRYVRSKPELADERLDGAVRALERMSKYYLPLLEARERTYDAHRFLYFGEGHRARTELQAVEDILDLVAETGGAELLPAMKEPLDLVSEAKAAVMASSEKAPELIKSLAVKLDQMALKGDLQLPHDWPAPESADD